jgi:antitoxin component YwqK of YwqJK toxin-antitoxin module
MKNQFNNCNSDEYKVLKELFNTMPLMDTNIANIIEEYIYSTVREYHSNGSIKCEYRTKYEEKDGEYKEWYETSLLERSESFRERSEYAGNSVEDRGKLMIQTNYIEHKEHGEYKEWYDNGQLDVHSSCTQLCNF